jgi:hypothetical protein
MLLAQIILNMMIQTGDESDWRSQTGMVMARVRGGSDYYIMGEKGIVLDLLSSMKFSFLCFMT